MADVSIIIRPARADDFSGLLAFGKDFYMGHDYLQYAFFQMLHSASHFPYVAVTDRGRVVGFKDYQIIDRKTVVGLAGRVLPEFQSSGINKALTTRMEKDVSEWYPDVCQKASVTRGNPRHDRFLQSRSHVQRIYKWNTFRGITDQIGRLQEIANTAPTCRILSYTASNKLLQTITNYIGARTSHLVCPGSMAMNIWEVNEANLRRVLQETDVIVPRDCSGAKFEGGLSIIGSRLGAADNLLITAIFYYGDSVDELLEHLRLALQHFARLVPEGAWRLGLTVQFPLQFNKQQLCEFLGQWFTEQFIPNTRSDFTLNILPFETTSRL